MNKKTVFGLSVFALAILSIKIGLKYLATFVYDLLNPTLQKPPYKVLVEVEKLHQTLIIADLHSDALLWDSNLIKKNSIGHVDIPRLIEGNVAIQVFSVVTKVPNFNNNLMIGDDSDQIARLAKVELWPIRSWSSLRERALYQAHKLERIMKRMNGKFLVITTSAELRDFLARREKDPELVAGILSLEGAHALEGNLDNINLLYNNGFRIIGLTHFSDNEIGGASIGNSREGITDYGRKVVMRLEARGLIIDLAHASHTLIEDVLAIATHPVIVTHTGVEGICPNSRNLSDNEIQQISIRGGIIGIGYDSFFNCVPGVGAIVRSIKYVADLVGVEHVALGSDYDGVIQAPFDTSGIALITQELMKTGFSSEEIRKIMGENVLDFLQQNLPNRE